MSKRTPRLHFTDAELSKPEVKEAARKAGRASDRLDKAEAKIPKYQRSVRTVDPETGKVTVRLSFEEKKPPSKLIHAAKAAPLNAAVLEAHRAVHENEDDNVGVESAHKTEMTAEATARTGIHAHRNRKMKPYRDAVKAENKADRANLDALEKDAAEQNPQFSSNPYSRWQQKRAIKKEYAAAKAGNSAGATTASAQEITAKATEKAAEKTKKAGEFFAKHKKGVLIAGGILLALILLLNIASSLSVLLQGSLNGVGISSYPSEDSDMLAAESQYAGKEAALQNELDHYESLHPGYDEYNYDLDTIEHDPYVLISMLTAMQGGQWTISDVQGLLQTFFDKQYTLSQTVVTEVRYRTETRTGTTTSTDPVTGETTESEYEYEVQVPYNYYICNVKLENFNLSHEPVYIMNQDQLSLYSVYMATLGNRPDLFPSSEYVTRYDTTTYPKYEIPPDALNDATFAAMITEAEKYLGYPYVWGGSSPSTSFDCSGFVSWVINHSGWNVGRLGAQGLYNICTPVSPANAKPGDLIFFQHTYDTTGASHVGIYVGNNMMIHCGDPIHYSNITESYWQQHFLGFGRLPSP
jgi:cell wall-associated NlpC family hydrolase